MRSAYSLLGGAVLATSVYAAEPTLHTTPDTGYSLVQGNADKALKVAYIVAGKTCQVGSSEGGSTVNIPMNGGKQMYSANLIIDVGEQTYNVIVMDMLNSDPDRLLFMIHKEKVTPEKARMGFARNTQIIDEGLDGHVNMGMDGRTAFDRQYMSFSNHGKINEMKKELYKK